MKNPVQPIDVTGFFILLRMTSFRVLSFIYSFIIELSRLLQVLQEHLFEEQQNQQEHSTD